MPQRSRGFVKLEWICPNCSTRNPGPKRSCTNCGAPQPENVEFQRAAEEKMVTDPEALKAARAGADYICPYCNTRNRGDAKVCVQCGGDLEEARRRTAGQELARNTGPTEVACTNCGTKNPVSRSNCSNCGSPLPRAGAVPQAAGAAAKAAEAPRKKAPRWWIWAALAAGVVVCAAAIGLFAVPTGSVPATVTSVHWETSVPVQEMRPVHHSNESGSPPSGAYDVSCHDESSEVCEERVVDQGNGYGEVVQDCHNESTQYCSYTVDEWETIQTYALEGTDHRPVFAQPSVSAGQRLGNESSTLSVIFDTEKGQKRYSPSSVQEFGQYSVGTSWTLSLNAVGAVLDVKP